MYIFCQPCICSLNIYLQNFVHNMLVKFTENVRIVHFYNFRNIFAVMFFILLFWCPERIKSIFSGNILVNEKH